MSSTPDEHPLWFPEDQAKRLSELIGGDETARDLPLRRDVRNLGLLLGRVLRAQCGEKVYAAEETLRRLAIRHREQLATAPSDPFMAMPGEARELVAGMPLAETYLVVKAFATFFELTNLAETNHRKRRLRAQNL
ncbi:MAG: phosphoenolpyruvate carboxylase, partial [Desulfuromonadales bacterium]